MTDEFPDRPPHPSKLDKIDITALDPRIVLERSSSSSTQRWLFEHDSQEYEFDYIKSTWVPATSKRAHDDTDEDQNRQDIKRQRKEEMARVKSELNELKQTHLHKTRKNHSIYISNLPSGLTAQKIESTFSTFGKIQSSRESGQPKIKMYYGESGAFKGDALVVYSLLDSAYLAIEMMDNTLFDGQTIRVEHARFEDKPREERKKGESREIVIGNMFRKEEMASDEYLKEDITEDIKEECDKIGIPNVLGIEFNADTGSVMVKFDSIENAKLCVQKFNNRYYDGLHLNVQLKT
ncbi:Cold sensitive U2 snRNA suppressor 2 [Candida viswanathii]|uniref:Cold sensitive U2 snRNA suppressor 2 n=1 Tax=Candida viswanathii TaxID=5486 RepID=A0A367YGU2_9ASCO|nr:Cold sensitive U2 snRNA suppressor 2 [Candida viswanathii]